jgi:hypothetical protein
VRAKDRDNRTRGKSSAHEYTDDNRSDQSGFDNGIFHLDVNVYWGNSRISCRGFAYSVNSFTFLLAKSSPEISGRRLLLYGCAFTDEYEYRMTEANPT